ncbi:MAG: DUF2062 domain-containing protein [Pseudomonadota bacterium]
MPKHALLKHLPTPAELRENRFLKPVAHMLHVDEIWHMNRRSVSGAVFIGLFSAFMPVPFQMVVAAFLAIISRCNLPIAVALVWITNPVTIPPMFYFAYRLGAWLLEMELSTQDIEISLTWLWHNFGAIGWPLLFGSLVCGWCAGVTGFVLTRVIWRWRVLRRWRERRRRKRALRNSASAK